MRFRGGSRIEARFGGCRLGCRRPRRRHARYCGIGIVAAPGVAGESDGAEGVMGSTQKPVDPKAGAGARP